jgi:predicted TIM-barrel fold metal-dependent hydrolase
MLLQLLLILLFLIACLFEIAAQSPIPVADHHQHVFSPTIAELGKITPITSKDVIANLDEAGIKRGVLLSVAYMYGRPGREPQNEYEMVKQENDWVGGQAALYPKRLIAFCGFNPLKDYALAELERCAKNPNTRRGIKLHFGNSDVQMEDAAQMEKLKVIFRAANANRMAIVVHMRASFSLERAYGAEQARAFLLHLLPLATDIPIQIAHLGSAGPGYDDPKVDAFMDALIDGLNGKVSGGGSSIQNPKSKIQNAANLWFDLTTIVHPEDKPERWAMVLKRIRQIGAKRILYGSDAPLGGNFKPRESWAAIATKTGLTQDELKTIANNRAPYFK